MNEGIVDAWLMLPKHAKTQFQANKNTYNKNNNNNNCDEYQTQMADKYIRILFCDFIPIYFWFVHAVHSSLSLSFSLFYLFENVYRGLSSYAVI